MRVIRYFVGGLLLLLLFIFTYPAEAQNVLVKDQAQVIEEGGKPVGVKLCRIWRADTGYLYIIDLNYQRLAADGALVQMSKHLEFSVDPSYYAKSFCIITNTSGAITQSNGLFQDNQVKVTTTGADGQVKSTLYQLEDPVYFNGLLYDYLGTTGQLKTGEPFVMNVFDPETLTLGEESFTVNKGDYKYKNKITAALSIIKTGAQEPVAMVNSKGEIYWEHDAALAMDFRRIEPSEFPELKLQLAANGMIPGKTTVSYPRRSISSQIRLTMVTLKPEDYPLEDNRQKVSSRKTTGNRSELLLAIARDDRDFTGKVTLPVQHKELAPYLAGSATDYISPLLPGVKKLTGEILGSETDGWAATQKLVGWVAGFMHPAVLSKTLKTGEILAQPAGDSMEYAILFAALARSAGLPTRIASGMIFRDGIWETHTWNEVWLGEWVTVDPSQNQAAPDSLLIKLVHSDNIPAIQKMRVVLTGNLVIDLMDVRIPVPEATELNTTKTGVYDRAYWNAQYHCLLEAPEGWKLTEITDGDLPVLVTQPVSNADITGILTIFEVPEGDTLEQYLALHFPNIQVDIQQYQLIKQQHTLLEPEFITAGDYTVNQDDLKFRQQNWLADNGNVYYLLVCLAPEEQSASFENDFMKLREQFSVISGN